MDRITKLEKYMSKRMEIDRVEREKRLDEAEKLMKKRTEDSMERINKSADRIISGTGKAGIGLDRMIVFYKAMFFLSVAAYSVAVILMATRS